MKRLLRKNSFKNRFYFFLIYFFLISSVSAKNSVLLHVDVAPSHIILQNNIQTSQNDQIGKTLLNGVDYHLYFVWYVQKHSSQWFVFNKTVVVIKKKIVLSYNSINQSYFLRTKNKLLPFKNFSALMKYVLHYKTQVDLSTWQRGTYRVKLRVEGYSIKLFFPLNLIYKILLNTWDFNDESSWYYFDFSDTALSK